jgi:ankyrin repeat protein
VIKQHAAGRKHYLQDSPLHAAAKNGHVDIVHALLAKKPLINWKNRAGETALHACCQSFSGRKEELQDVVALLLNQKKVHADQVDGRGRTPAAVAKDPLIRAMLHDALQVCNIKDQCLHIPALYRFTERDGRKGPPAGNKAKCNCTNTPHSKTTRRKAKPNQKPQTHTRGERQA